MGRIWQETDLVFSRDWRSWVNHLWIPAITNYPVEIKLTHYPAIVALDILGQIR